MIPLKPTQLPVWATNDQIDSVSGANNVEQPPPELQTYGWPRGIFPPRNFFNWLGRQTYECLAYLFALQNQEITTTDASGATPIFDVVNGGMCLAYIIDTGAFSTWFEGIVYIPPGYSSGTTSLRQVAANGSTLTISAISATGAITVTGGTGAYVIFGKTKTPGI
jgi:hypothetical protein